MKSKKYAMNNPYTYRAIAIKHALILYAKAGIKANRAYTPTAMLKAAEDITGIKYKRGQYALAAADIDKVLQNETLRTPTR